MRTPIGGKAPLRAARALPGSVPPMTQELFSQVDRWIIERLVRDDFKVDTSGLPAIEVTPNQGKLLYLLAKLVGARRILELGTLGGYSTIWLARALPDDGRLITLEADPHHAEVAASNLKRHGVDHLVDLRVGPALETLPQVDGPFDLIFIDADKASQGAYPDEALERSRPGTLILGDNVVRGGGVIDAPDDDPKNAGIRSMFDRMAASPIWKRPRSSSWA
jgi:predicted O-methyltransferase YrrM